MAARLPFPPARGPQVGRRHAPQTVGDGRGRHRPRSAHGCAEPPTALDEACSAPFPVGPCPGDLSAPSACGSFGGGPWGAVEAFPCWPAWLFPPLATVEIS